ncbi:golgin subfamily A member 4 isoform X4 [Octopus sinensis]|uniref:Golgin subfamily A member 4 isoform X4 n=1 Tax=Octopus sinensis TaxID=2607531 RepID=A0A7E6F3J9_9MOLL|nr:golgin subfamily A member 4 isoform X4 [Octopus sinensis]
MFRKLIKKLEQGVGNSNIPLPFTETESNVSLSNTDNVSAKSPTGNVDEPIDTASVKTDEVTVTNNVSLDTANSVSSPSSPTMGMLIDIPLNDGSLIESSAEEFAADDDVSLLGKQQEQPNSGMSVISLGAMSPNTSASSAYETPFQSPLPPIHYQMPSDIESEIEESAFNVDILSKEELYTLVKKYEHRARRYKSKFNEIVITFKELLQEQEKLKKNLAHSQDKSFRRISELKEQINLDQLAKRDLEENYRLMLDEKDEQVNVLKTQVRLLKEGKDISVENYNQSKETASAVGNEKPVESISALHEKVKRLENLLGKCRETIKNNKERTIVLCEENDNLKTQLKKIEEAHLTSNSSTEINRLQNQIKQAREVIEQLEKDRELAIAEGKKSVYEAIEEKDKEISEIRASFQVLQGQFDDLAQSKKEVDRQAAEQLEKSREIIKQLKEEKKQAIIQLEDKLKHAEKTMEEEKENLVQELSRGKALAISLVQEEHEKALEEKVKTAIQEQENIWKEKLDKIETSHQDALTSKLKEQELWQRQKEEDFYRQLAEYREEMRLAIEERELQKMAALSQQDSLRDALQCEIGELKSEKIEMQQRIIQLEEAKSKLEEEHAEFMDKSRLANEDLVKELTERHSAELTKALEEQESQSMEKLQSYIQKHSEELEVLRINHQEEFVNSNTELYNYYESKLEKVLSGYKQMLSEKNNQLEQANHNVQVCKEKMSAMQVQFESRTQGFETRLAELQKTLQSEKDNCIKLQKEMENSKIQYEEGIQNLKDQCNERFNYVHQLEEEKGILKKELELTRLSKMELEKQVTKELDKQASHSGEELSKIQTLEKEHQKFIETITLMTVKEETMKKESTSLDKELKLIKEKNNQLLDTIDSKEKKLLDVEATFESLLKTNEKMNEELETSKLLVNTLEQEKEQCKEEIQCLQSNLTQQGNDIEKMMQENVFFKSHGNELEEKNANLEKELNLKIVAFEEKIIELENSLQKITELREENDCLKKLNESLEDDKFQLNTEWKIKMDKLQAVKDAELSDVSEEHSTKLMNSICEYQDKLKDMASIKEQLTLEKNEAIKESNLVQQQLAKKYQEAESIIIVLNDKNSDYEKQIKELLIKTESVDEIKQELMENRLLTQQQVDNLQQENSQLKEKYEEEMSEKDSKMSLLQTSLEQKLAEKTCEIEELQSQLSNNQINDAELQENLKTLREKLSVAEDKLSDCIQNYDRDIEELKANVETREKELSKKTHEFHQKENQLKAKIDDLDSHFKDNQAETNNKIMLLESRIQESQEKHLQIEDLEEKIDILAKDKESLTDELKEATSKLVEYTKSNEEKHISEKENENLLKEVESLRNIKVNIECQLDEKETFCQEYSVKINEVEEKLRQSEDNLKLVQGNYEQLQKKYEILNCSTKSVAEEIQEKQAEVVSVSQKLSLAVSERDQLKAEMEKKINELLEDHQLKLTKMETEANNKKAEYKKKAEIYISQLKKQSEECQQTAISEQKKSTKEIEHLKEELKKIKNEKKLMEEDFAQWKIDHLEKMRDRENILQDKLQLAENKRTSESQVKSENEQLNRQLLNLEMKISQQEEMHETEIKSLKLEKENLSQQLQKLKSSSEESKLNSEKKHTEEVEFLKKQHELEKQEVENIHNAKIKALVKDIHQQLAEKDKGYEESFNEALERCQQEETNMMRQHRREIDEMTKELNLSQKAYEDLEEKYHTELQKIQEEMEHKSHQLQNQIDHEGQIHQEKLVELQGKLEAKFNQQTESLQKQHNQEVSALSSEWNHERKELVVQNQCTLEAVQSGTPNGEVLRRQVIDLTHQLEMEKEKHKLQIAELQTQNEMHRSQLAEPLLAAPSLDDDYNADLQNLQLDNTDLKLQVKHLNDDLAECHTQIEVLLQKIDKLENTSIVEPESSSVLNTTSYHYRDNYNCNLNEPLLREPTEFEYLKNILYQYMIGKETKTLAKVIATVVQFSDDQTNNIMAQEDIRATI